MTLHTQAAIRDLDPVFAEMAAASFRPSGDGPDVTARERILITLVTDVCGQVFDMPFDLHVRAALDAGLDADDLRELLRFTAYESGYPAALTALERLTEIEREHGLPRPTGQGHQVNADGTGSPMPAAVRAQVQSLDPGFVDYMDLQSRMRADMSRISVREKAFTSMAVDVVYQTLQGELPRPRRPRPGCRGDACRGPGRRPRHRAIRDDPDLARAARPERAAGRGGDGTTVGEGKQWAASQTGRRPDRTTGLSSCRAVELSNRLRLKYGLTVMVNVLVVFWMLTALLLSVSWLNVAEPTAGPWPASGSGFAQMPKPDLPLP